MAGKIVVYKSSDGTYLMDSSRFLKTFDSIADAESFLETEGYNKHDRLELGICYEVHNAHEMIVTNLRDGLELFLDSAKDFELSAPDFEKTFKYLTAFKDAFTVKLDEYRRYSNAISSELGKSKSNAGLLADAINSLYKAGEDVIAKITAINSKTVTGILADTTVERDAVQHYDMLEKKFFSIFRENENKNKAEKQSKVSKYAYERD